MFLFTVLHIITQSTPLLHFYITYGKRGSIFIKQVKILCKAEKLEPPMRLDVKSLAWSTGTILSYLVPTNKFEILIIVQVK